MTPDQRQVLFGNTARAMADAALHIKDRHLANCAKADPAYGDGVAKVLVKVDAVKTKHQRGHMGPPAGARK